VRLGIGIDDEAEGFEAILVSTGPPRHPPA
jgi:hypothetical protein